MTKIKNLLFKKSKAPKITPLHLAYYQKNNKSINVILKYLAELEFTQFKTFGDLAPDLVGYTGFIAFLYEQTFQTVQMQNKSVFRFEDKHTDDFVKIQESYSSYIDDVFYSKSMQESVDPQANSYSVNIVALEVGWILNDKDQDQNGQKFLAAITNSDRNDLFDLLAIKILIEWLYKEYKFKIVLYQGPQYVLTLVFYLATIYYHESVERTLAGEEGLMLQQIGEQDGRGSLNFVATCSIFCTIITILTIIYQTSKVGSIYWGSPWPYIDSIYSLFNFMVSVMIINEAALGVEIKYLRIFEAITALVLWTKSLYFLRIIDEMNVIIEIMIQMIIAIYPFMIVLIVVIFAFANAFWLIGRNQLQFDKLYYDDGDSEHAPPLYAETTIGAF